MKKNAIYTVCLWLLTVAPLACGDSEDGTTSAEAGTPSPVEAGTPPTSPETGTPAIDAKAPFEPSIAITADASPLEPGQLRGAGLTITNLDAPVIAWSVTGPAAVDGAANGSTVNVRTSAAIDATSVVTLLADVTGNDGAGRTRALRATATFVARGTRHVTDDRYSVARDTPLEVAVVAGVLANDITTPGDYSNVSVVHGPAHGRLVLGRLGDFGYQPDRGYVGPDSFTYQFTEAGETASATATIDVTAGSLTAVDDYIVVSSSAAQSWLTLEDFIRNDQNPEGGPLTVRYSLPNGLTFDTPTKANLPGLLFPPPFGETPEVASFHPTATAYRPSGALGSPFSVPYTITDAKGNTSSAIATILILPGASATSADFTIRGDESTVITMVLVDYVEPTILLTAAPTYTQYTGTLYSKLDSGARGPAITTFPYEVLHRSGHVFFVPQPFKHSARNPDGSYQDYATIPYLSESAWKQTAHTVHLVVIPIDALP